MLEFSEELAAKQAYALQVIREAFHSVDRVGGVSWSEADVIDDYGTEDEAVTARARDTESSWEALAQGDVWEYDGFRQWSFLDPIGFRYYLPAAMTLALLKGDDREIAFHLTLEPKDRQRSFSLEKWSMLNEKQRLAVKVFLEVIEELDNWRYEQHAGTFAWREAYESYWADLS